LPVRRSGTHPDNARRATQRPSRTPLAQASRRVDDQGAGPAAHGLCASQSTTRYRRWRRASAEGVIVRSPFATRHGPLRQRKRAGPAANPHARPGSSALNVHLRGPPFWAAAPRPGLADGSDRRGPSDMTPRHGGSGRRPRTRQFSAHQQIAAEVRPEPRSATADEYRNAASRQRRRHQAAQRGPAQRHQQRLAPGARNKGPRLAGRAATMDGADRIPARRTPQTSGTRATARGPGGIQQRAAEHPHGMDPRSRFKRHAKQVGHHASTRQGDWEDVGGRKEPSRKRGDHGRGGLGGQPPTGEQAPQASRWREPSSARSSAGRRHPWRAASRR